MNDREQKIKALWKKRPRSLFLRWSLVLLFGFGLFSWFSGEIDVADLFTSQRMENVDRFLTQELVPPSVREGGSLGEWAKNLFTQKGGDAFLKTLHISVISILFAGVIGLFLTLPAARNFMHSFWTHFLQT